MDKQLEIEERKKLVNELFGPLEKSPQEKIVHRVEDIDTQDNENEFFCGTFEFNRYSEKIERLLSLGMTKEEIISMAPKSIQILIKYFDNL